MNHRGSFSPVIRNYAAVLPFQRFWGSLTGRGLVHPTRKSRVWFPTRPEGGTNVVTLMKKALFSGLDPNLPPGPSQISDQELIKAINLMASDQVETEIWLSSPK